jgi:hypothetical protein
MGIRWVSDRSLQYPLPSGTITLGDISFRSKANSSQIGMGDFWYKKLKRHSQRRKAIYMINIQQIAVF